MRISQWVIRQWPIRAAACVFVVAGILATAQDRPAAQQQNASASLQAYPKVQLTTSRSTVVLTNFDIVRLAITNPAIADGLYGCLSQKQDGDRKGEQKPGRDIAIEM